MSRAKQRLPKRKPPPALAACRVEQYAIRDRSMKYSGHSSLFRDGKEVGPVPRLAICRGDDNEVLLLHCDRRWNVLGMAGGYPNIKAAKRRAERIYPGISAAWAKAGVTRWQVRRYLDRIGRNVKMRLLREVIASGRAHGDARQRLHLRRMCARTERDDRRRRGTSSRETLPNSASRRQ